MPNNPSKDIPMLIPDSFGHKIRHNPMAAGWMDTLPELIPYFCARWHLTDIMPAENMSYNYVLFAQQRGRDVALKLSWDRPSFLRECEALSAYASTGASVRLLGRCKTRRALLLSRAATLARGLGFEKKRILAWSFVQAALATCWDLEDQGKPDRWMPGFKILHQCWKDVA